MKKSNVSKFFKNIGKSLTNHSPEILTGIGIAGMITTTVLAVKATPKAIRLIEDKKDELVTDKLTIIDTVKTTWKCYIPATVTGTVSIACLIGASSVHVKRNAVLATAYKLSESALTEYREKVIETIGEKKEQLIRDKVDKDRVENNPVSKHEVIITEQGSTLCYDPLTDRYFKSDIDKLKKAENEINSRILEDGNVCLNDFYYEIGIGSAEVGDDIGWSYNKDRLVKLRLSSQLAEGTPCIVLGFQTAPYYGYDKY